MKDITSINNESIVYIVADDTTRRMLKMYLAAIGLNARAYASSEEYYARHNPARTQYLVLDMQLPGMDGAILKRQKITDGQLTEENSENFTLIPIKNQRSCQPLFLKRFANKGWHER